MTDVDEHEHVHEHVIVHVAVTVNVRRDFEPTREATPRLSA